MKDITDEILVAGLVEPCLLEMYHKAVMNIEPVKAEINGITIIMIKDPDEWCENPKSKYPGSFKWLDSKHNGMVRCLLCGLDVHIDNINNRCEDGHKEIAKPTEFPSSWRK